MKKLLIALVPMLVLFIASLPAQEVIKETETHSVFKGLFLNVWSKLRSFNPHSRQEARIQRVYTAGIRGAESTETLIQPYWKDDLSQDEEFQAQLQSFSQAQQLMDNGQLEQSVQAFNAFLDQHGNSALAANARFGRGLCQAGLGQPDAARADLQQFIEDYPNHPLAADAGQIIAQLN